MCCVQHCSLRSMQQLEDRLAAPHYFTDPEGYDERIMLTGVRLARTIAEQAPLKGWVARELSPGPDPTTDEVLLDYIHLRVKGVSRLRVVDASAMPRLPAVNPNITVMTMAEKCADLIRKG